VSAEESSKPRRLNVLRAVAAATADDLLRLFLQTGQRRAGELAEGETLEIGVAYASAEFTELPEANMIWDACLPEGLSASEAVAMADAHFLANGSRCGGWLINPSIAAMAAAPFADYLVGVGFQATRSVVMRLEAAAAESTAPPDIRVIPARASFRHARALAEGLGFSSAAIEAELRRLDDPHWDRLLALSDGEVIGGVGVLAVGEIGRIDDLQVLPAHRGRGIGAMLLSRAIEICRRSQFRHVLAGVDENNVAAIAFFKSAGFVATTAAERFLRRGKPA
jgi:ribosomal protein S18 acetylase RimI-like enzyme